MPDSPTYPQRFPWGSFPPVVRNGNLGELKQQPEYERAKAGDSEAALEFEQQFLLTSSEIASLRQDMNESSKWMREELARRRSNSKKQKTD